MRRVLMVSYHFPPMSAAGVHRPLGFVRHLPAHGWLPHVVTVAGTAAYAEDPGLLRALPPEVAVERAANLSTSHVVAALVRLGLRESARLLEAWLRAPDGHWPWAAGAALCGLRAHRRAPFDAIWTTSPPASAHLAGLLLAETTGRPWVADFRNEWTTHPERPRPATPVHACFEAALEAATVRRAAAVTTLAPPHTALLRAGYPNRAGRIGTIEGGADPEDFAGLEAVHPPADRFVIGYPGTFFGADSPRIVLDAVDALARAGEVEGSRVQLRVAGYLWEAAGCLRTAGDRVRYDGNLSHAAALRLCRESTVQLLLLVGKRRRSFPGKMYEYLASGRPILAVLPRDAECRAVVAESGGAIFADPDDPGSVRDAVRTLYARWRVGELGPAPLGRVPPERCRPAAAGALARVLDAVCRERRG